MKKNLLLFLALIILAAIAYWIFNKKTTSSIADEPLTDFAIEDTASVSKFFIVDHFGKTALIERVHGQKLWKLNNKYLAREDAVNNILQVFNRIRVRGNVPNAGKENMLKIIATSGMKVEIFQGKSEPSKIYYIGSSTPDHLGTIMLLEIPGIGRSREPYITHLEGFSGFLNPRFFADEMEWRYTGIFEFPDLKFSEVQVLSPLIPENSFSVQYKGENSISLTGGFNPLSGTFNTPIARFDTLAVQDLLLRFRKVHVESYNTLLKPEVADSISHRIPEYIVRVIDGQGQASSVNIYIKKAKEARLNAAGEMSIWDPEYYWIKTPSGEMALGQSFVFEPLIAPLGAYLPKGI